LLQTLPDTPERTQQELTLRIALGVPLMASKGYTAPEVEQAYTRALELCRQVGEPSQLFSVLLGLSSFYMIRGELQTARDLTEQCLCLAQSMHSSTHLISAHDQLGKILFFLGEFALAQNHTEQGIALYDLQERKPLFSGAVNNPKVSCLGFAARVLWVLGYPDQALQKSQAALTLARGLAHPLSLAFAFHSAAWLYQGSREERLVQEQAEAMTALAREYGIVTQVTRGTILRGWALAEQGKTEEGIWQIQQGLVTSQDRSAELGRLQDLILLAEAYRKAGRAEEGLSVLAEVPDFVEKTKERNYEAELYRLKGELTLQKLSVVSRQLSVTDPRSPTPDPQGEAEACFHKAIAIAQKQQAKSLELRAVMSLVRLRQQQATQEESRNIDHASRNTYHASRSRLDEAHQLLAEIYGWFTEGFDTKDLQEAKALLDSLESSVKTGSRFNS
jgi:predicted ATPase